MDATVNDMPAFVSHKRVQAAPIVEVHEGHNGFDAVTVDLGDGRKLRVPCETAMFLRHAPAPGDYLVRYSDGYLSFSPKRAFDEGYTVARDPTTAG